MAKSQRTPRGPLVSLFLALAACAEGGPARSPEPPVAARAAASPGTPTGRADASTDVSEEDAEVPISGGNPTWGSRRAPVTIVEFGDLECPFCLRAEGTLAQIRSTYGPEGVRIVWKNYPLPFHKSARPAAEAAMGVFALAGPEAFWKFYDSALHATGPRTEPDFVRWAKEAGLTDLEALRAGLQRGTWTAAVERDLSDAKALGVFGTPCFFVNGLPLAGALPFVTFQVLIDEQTRRAKAKIDAGTAPEKVYAELTHDNRAAAQAETADAEEDDTKTVHKVPIGKSPARGPATALVTIVEFADYECPYCVRAEPTLHELRDQYGDQLRFVFKDSPLPFHPRAEPAAEAALEVRAERGDDAFWEMHDALLAGSADLSDEGLVALAGKLGARADAVRAAIAGHAHQRQIETDQDVADDFEANGTPHFFVNGRRLVGAQPKEAFAAIIDQEIVRARELLAKGAKPSALYEELVRDGEDAPAPERRALATSLPEHSPGRGRERARVTVHEWSDFQCPYCSQAEPTLAKLTHDYAANVRLVWHDLPLPIHPDARLAARAAREALAQKGERAFWTIHDAMFAHQQALDRSSLDGYARSLGLDMTRWAKALDGDVHEGELDADKTAADVLQISGTPSFLIVPAGAHEGYFLAGAQGYGKFRRLVERALSEAK